MPVVPVTASGVMVSDVPRFRISTDPDIVKNAPVSHGRTNALYMGIDPGPCVPPVVIWEV